MRMPFATKRADWPPATFIVTSWLSTCLKQGAAAMRASKIATQRSITDSDITPANTVKASKHGNPITLRQVFTAMIVIVALAAIYHFTHF
jgi:hypothetical protein